MPTIRPTRQEVSDRFPVLGFTVNTGHNPLYEVVLTTDPALARLENKVKRSATNFYSTRAAGPLRAERGESVHLVSPAILSRFVGQKLFYGLATFPDASRTHPEIVATPKPDSPWINLRGLTGRGFRRMRLGAATPRRRASNGNGYGAEAPASLEWAGDIAQPGTEPVAPSAAPAAPSPSAGAPTAPSTQAAALDYDDGFGPLALEAEQETEAADTEGIEGPIDDSGLLSQAQAYSQPFATSPEYPGASSFVQARHRRTPSSPRTIQRVVIHITDGQGQARGTADYFQDPMHWLSIDVENGELQMELEDGKCKRFRYKNAWKECVNGRTQTKGSKTLGLARVPVSAHYAVGQDGEVIQMVKHGDVAFHASSANGDTIGIEHNARTPRTFNAQDPGLFPTDDQYRASARLVCWLAREFNIPKDRDHILGHAEADPTTSHTDCPTGAWDWGRYWGFITDGSCDPEPATAAAQAAGESFDTHWTDVPLIAQLQDQSCWEAAADMVASWAGRSYSPTGPDPQTIQEIARLFSLEAEPAQSYTIEAFRNLLETKGPLWLAAKVPGFHAVVVTGMYSDGTPDGSDTFVRIQDPWDRDTGAPGNPGAYLDTHNTGSRYVLSWRQLIEEYEDVPHDPELTAVNVQILHNRDTGGRRPGVGEAQSFAAGRSARAMATSNGARQPKTVARQQQVAEVASAIVGAAMTRILDNEGDISWELDQLQGLKHIGNDATNTGSNPYQTQTLSIPGPHGSTVFGADKIYADSELTFQYNGRSLGNIQVTVTNSNDAVGLGLVIKEQIMDDANTYTLPSSADRFAAVKIRFHYRFTSPLYEDMIAITDLVLFGNGTFNQHFRWTQR